MTSEANFPGVGVLRSRPVAVVYSDDFTGPADGDDTGAVSAMLASAAGWNFEVITAGPNGTMSVPQALARPGVRLYAQPGADGDDDAAYRRQKRDKSAIKHFVHEGGRYLGICMGGFLAEPGHFNVFGGRVDEYYSSRGASVTTADPAVIPVLWRGTRRPMYSRTAATWFRDASPPGSPCWRDTPTERSRRWLPHTAAARSACAVHIPKLRPSGTDRPTSVMASRPKTSVTTSSTPSWRPEPRRRAPRRLRLASLAMITAMLASCTGTGPSTDPASYDAGL